MSSLTPKLWESVIVQGRGDSSGWVTKFKIQYTIDGKTWMDYENGKEFSGNFDRNTKVTHNLKPFYATVVRIAILGWHAHIALRFDFVFLE